MTMKLAIVLFGLTTTVSHAFVAPRISNVAPVTTQLFDAKDISALTKDVETIYTSEDIDKLLPHRYPFALVDKVVEYEAGKRAVGIKSVTKNEEFFNGHFPGRPISKSKREGS